jgi:Family of unknown function (DUF5989)
MSTEGRGNRTSAKPIRHSNTVKNGVIRRPSVAGKLLSFLWKNKWWWLIPLIMVLVALGVLVVFSQRSASTPFIYLFY